MAEFPVVALDNSDNDVEPWMREDNHGPKFDTGCNMIVTKAENLDKDLERKFKNVYWIVFDPLPKGKKLKVEKPVYELFSKIVAAHCPFAKKPKVSYYDKYEYISNSYLGLVQNMFLYYSFSDLTFVMTKYR